MQPPPKTGGGQFFCDTLDFNHGLGVINSYDHRHQQRDARSDKKYKI